MTENDRRRFLVGVMQGVFFGIAAVLGIEVVLFMGRMVYLIWQVKP